jgi:hypothetical protein
MRPSRVSWALRLPSDHDAGSNDSPPNFTRGPYALSSVRSAAAVPAAVKAGRNARPAGVALTAAGRR